MAAFLDVCRFTPTAGGTTDWTVSAAVTGYQTPANAGAVNATVYRYRAESADLSQWEVGYGAYTSAGTVLARTTVLFNSSGTTAKINFTATPQVAVVALKEDLISIEEANSFTATQRARARSNIATVLRGQKAGLALSPGGASSFGIAAGEAADSTNVDLIALASALSKTSAAWAVGTGNGSFDGTGSAPTTTAGMYHVHLIKRPDTGVVDVLTSNSVTAPTLPTNYTLFRRIGSVRSNGAGAWYKYTQTGDWVLYDTPVVDVNGAANPGTAAVTRTLTTPLGVKTQAIIHVMGAANNGSTDSLGGIYISDLAQADVAAGSGSASVVSVYLSAAATFQLGATAIVTTDLNSAVRSRLQLSSAGASLYLVTLGYIDRCGRDD